MLNKKTNLYNQLFEGLFFILAGILFIIKWKTLWALIHIILTTGFIYHGLTVMIPYLINKERIKPEYAAEILFSFAVSGFAAMNPTSFVKFLPFIIGLWAMLHGIIQSINFYVYRRDCMRGTGWRFVIAFVTLTVAIILILFPSGNLKGLSIIAGLYLIFYGLVNVSRIIKDMLSPVAKRKLLKHMSFSIPIFLSALLPSQVFLSIESITEDTQNKEDPEADLEVFIYLSKSGPESLGHTDISYKGKIYSYGCHDPENRRLMGTLGDGVLIVSDRDAFLKHALSTENKTVLSYGISLDEKSKKIIESRIDEMMKRTVSWQPIIQRAGGDLNAKDYASRVYRGTKAEMYKFFEGKFRTYFVFSTNCVLLADHILRSPQLDLFNFIGIVTPGSYLAFLNDEYQIKGSMVVKRKVYRRIEDV